MQKQEKPKHRKTRIQFYKKKKKKKTKKKNKKKKKKKNQKKKKRKTILKKKKKKKCRKCRFLQTRVVQSNDHTWIIHKVQFHSSLNG